MKYFSKILMLLVLLICYSCKNIYFNFNKIPQALYSNYGNINKKFPELLVNDSNFCNYEYKINNRVFIINAPQLKNCLSDYNDAIVYIWAANCKGKECYSPSLLQKYCDEKKVELFVIAEYYSDDLTQFYEIERPIFGIDTKYYKTDYIDKYTAKFAEDLIGHKKSNTGRMLYFKNGKYKGTATIKFEN